MRRLMNILRVVPTTSILLKESLTRNSNEDPALAVASCADLHWKSIEQMKINRCSLQDLKICGSLSQVPVIYVEQHMIQCQRSCVVEDVASLGLDGPLKKNKSYHYAKCNNK